MRLLLDTDAFCKLGVAGLLRDAVNLLGASLSECGRLAGLTHMLRRRNGSLRRLYGPEACDRLTPIAEELPVIGSASHVWLDKLSPIDAIDAGEALLFAVAAAAGLVVVSDDKRALRALKDLPGFADALAGRIVVLEAILVALCDQLGADEVRRRVKPVAMSDTMIRVCFSAANSDPREALSSYLRSLLSELDPLVLWEPEPRGRR